MAFDWINFFDIRQIPYVTHGPNTSRGQIAIRCIWCGNDDPGEHLSINLAGKGFRCWRQPQHSGRNPAKLIQALLNCSWEQANAIAGQERSLPSDFLGKLKASFSKPVAETKQKLKLPTEFKQFSNLPSCKLHQLYLHRRGFSNKDIEQAKDYGIYYASQGEYKGRVIFTVTMNDELCGWTGRTIYPTEQVRYKTLSTNVEYGITAPNPISHYLLFYDKLKASDADTIVLNEGPFDSWRVNLLGAPIGVVATCFFTSMLSNEQLNLLHEILPRFRRKVLMLDEGTFTKSAKIRADLAALDVEVCRLRDTKDAGELLSTKQLKDVLDVPIR